MSVSRCWPMRTRSRAASKSRISIIWLPRRTACSADSFTRLARSAPLIPQRAFHERSDPEVDVWSDSLVASVDLQDRLSLFKVGEGNNDLAVEAARPERVQGPRCRSVCRGEHHDAFGGVEAVHLREHLVQGLFALVMSAAEPGATLASDRVDLVNEDDRRSLLASCLEQVAHSARRRRRTHFHEVRAADREERHARFASNSAGEQGLSGSGGPTRRTPARDARADIAKSSQGSSRNPTTSLISCFTAL